MSIKYLTLAKVNCEGYNFLLSVEDIKMVTATARHILVDTEEKCEDIKVKISEGADFAEMAEEHSNCPSGKSGGDLGSFRPGQMVSEFDEVVFSEDVGMVHGPIQTQFGYHLIEITSRVD